MSESDGLEEVVVLFSGDGSSVVEELRYTGFEALVNQKATLEAFAGTAVKAAYGTVGTGLALRGLVLFMVKVDGAGRVGRDFNVPLRYLLSNAGSGPDLGAGEIRMASRSQCSVAWHSVNLWEPTEGLPAEAHPAYLVQKALWRNRLGLKPTASGRNAEARDALPELLPNDHRQLEARLVETIDEAGKLSLEQLIGQYNAQVKVLAERYRDDVQQQQRSYLEQIRSARDEVQKLKSALRHEQDKTRRLQSLLRGEP